ncbi:host attachment protein [Pseudorhodobacter sp. W20_MBD10_FR17]|uniref:host attachment protein n=1 Tax=Pseudorhodobacter sp. W20_MBD10_FR17 TaxID=3240266 RepID=UPI003F984D4B
MKLERIWHIVMDDSRSRILRRLPSPHEATPAEIVIQGKSRDMRDVYQDRQTRSFASAGGGRRFGVEPSSNPIEKDARNLMQEVLSYLEDQQKAGAFDKLVVIAPAQAIGRWRAEISDGLRASVQKEIVKNLMQLSPPELVGAIRALSSA